MKTTGWSSSPERWMASLMLAAAIALSPAFAMKVNVDHADDFDFRAVSTFAWVEGTPAENELNERRIRAAVESALAAAGYALAAEGEEPDLQVATHASVKGEQRSSNVRIGLGVSRSVGSSGRVSVGGSPGGRPRTIDVGTLVIDLVEAGSGRLVWRGEAEDSLKGDLEKKIRTAVDRAFKKFPPETK